MMAPFRNAVGGDKKDKRPAAVDTTKDPAPSTGTTTTGPGMVPVVGIKRQGTDPKIPDPKRKRT